MKSILFVCMGNICRSPAAEGVFRHMAAKAGLDGTVNADSAGTIGFHSGDPADKRMCETAQGRGYQLLSSARQVRLEDFARFDLILAMDRDNLSDLQRMREGLNGDADLRLFSDYCREHTAEDVPDPYYGGRSGFEKVLDMIEDGCGTLIEEIKAKHAS